MFVQKVIASVKPSFKRCQRRPHSKPVAVERTFEQAVEDGDLKALAAQAQEYDEIRAKYEALMKVHEERALKMKKLQEGNARLEEEFATQEKETMEADGLVTSLTKGSSEKDTSIAALKEENACLKLQASQLSAADSKTSPDRQAIDKRLPQESQEINSLGRGNSRIRGIFRQLEGSCQRARSKLESARALLRDASEEEADSSILRHLPTPSEEREIVALRSDNAYLVERLQSSQDTEAVLLERARHLECKLALTMQAYAVRQEVAEYMDGEHSKQIAALKMLVSQKNTTAEESVDVLATPSHISFSISGSPAALSTPSLIPDNTPSLPGSPITLPTSSLISDDGSSTSGSPLVRPLTPIMDLDFVSAGFAGLGAGSPVEKLDVPPAGLAIFDYLFPVDCSERISDEERCEALDLSVCLGIPASMPTFWELEEGLARVI